MEFFGEGGLREILVDLLHCPLHSSTHVSIMLRCDFSRQRVVISGNYVTHLKRRGVFGLLLLSKALQIGLLRMSSHLWLNQVSILSW